MFVLDDLLDFLFIIYHFNGGLKKTSQEESYRFIPGKDALGYYNSIQGPGQGLSQPGWVGAISLVDFSCLCPSLSPDYPALPGEEIVAESHVNIMEGVVVSLGNILEFFNRTVRISSVGANLFFYLKEFA